VVLAVINDRFILRDIAAWGERRVLMVVLWLLPAFGFKIVSG
jgi:hypothetical protein